MSLANVNIGLAPDDNTGDPLRTAFNKINNNFANLAGINGNANVIVYATGNANVTAVYNPGVESVAGRKGNVILTVNDVIGAVSTGQANVYVPSNPAHWDPVPNTISAALNQLAARIWDLENP